MSFIALMLFVIVALTMVVGLGEIIRDLRADAVPQEFYRLTPLSSFFDAEEDDEDGYYEQMMFFHIYGQTFSDMLIDELYWEQEYYPPMDWDTFYPMEKTQAEVHADLKTVFSNHRTVCRSMHRQQLRV